MVTIKMILTNASGTPLGTEIEFPASVVYGKDYEKRRVGQVTHRALDGALSTFDRGVTVVSGEIAIRGMSIADKAILETFIVTTMNFNEKYFKIETTPCSLNARDLDLGNGFGIAIGVCKFSEDFTSTEGVFTFKAPAIYDVRIPYTYTL